MHAYIHTCILTPWIDHCISVPGLGPKRLRTARISIAAVIGLKFEFRLLVGRGLTQKT